MQERVERHRRACGRFTAVASAARPADWARPSPCADWDARGVVEHVIGFHEVLVLRPLGVKVRRPRDDPATRWAATSDGLFAALAHDVPGDIAQLLPALTTEVLVHTWDLARALGIEPDLDPELVERAHSHAAGSTDAIRGSGMYQPPVPVSGDASVPHRLVALLGRDPRWH